MKKPKYRLSVIGELNRLFVEARSRGETEIPKKELRSLCREFGEEVVNIYMKGCKQTAFDLPNKYVNG